VQGQQARRLRHFHYLDWPDNGVPDKLGLLGFVELVRDQIPSRGGPIVVHCRFVQYTFYVHKPADFMAASVKHRSGGCLSVCLSVLP